MISELRCANSSAVDERCGRRGRFLAFGSGRCTRTDHGEFDAFVGRVIELGWLEVLRHRLNPGTLTGFALASSIVALVLVGRPLDAQLRRGGSVPGVGPQ